MMLGVKGQVRRDDRRDQGTQVPGGSTQVERHAGFVGEVTGDHTGSHRGEVLDHLRGVHAGPKQPEPGIGVDLGDDEGEVLSRSSSAN